MKKLPRSVLVCGTPRRYVFGDGAARSAVPYVIGHPQATAKYLVMPPRGVDFSNLMALARQKRTLPLWSNSVVVYGSQTYNYTMVGTDPTAGGTINAPIQFQLFKFIFADGSTFDPSQPACGDKVSVIDRVLRSPLFASTDIVSNGVDVGGTQ